MKIDITLSHKEYQPEIEGMQCLPDGYTVNVTRSDGRGLTKLEALTALQTCIADHNNSKRNLTSPD
jgi:hypothetical protein